MEPAGEEEVLSCSSCELAFLRSAASRAPTLRRGLLPVAFAWAMAPALLLVAAGLLEPGPYGWPSTSLGRLFAMVALAGGPFILYVWSAVLFRHRRVEDWAFEAVPVTLGLCFVNGVAGVFAYSLITDSL